MRFYYDTEFLEDGKTIDLISIGIVADSGAEYYAVNKDADWDRIEQDEWLSRNVTPHLGPWDLRKFKSQIALGVSAFIKDNSDGDPTELWAYYSAYDHVALAQLFGKMIHLPKHIPKYTNDLKSHADWHGWDLPKQTGTEHHALADARWVRDAFRASTVDADLLRHWDAPLNGGTSDCAHEVVLRASGVECRLCGGWDCF